MFWGIPPPHPYYLYFTLKSFTLFVRANGTDFMIALEKSRSLCEGKPARQKVGILL